MYKLCVVLGFLAIAAAKPSWPLPYSAYPAIPSAAYPTFGSAAIYSAAPGYSVVPKTYSTQVASSFPTSFATSYSYNKIPAVVNPVVTPAQISAAAIATAPGYGVYPSPYAAAVAPFGVAPFSAYAYGTPFAWKKK